MSHVRAWLVAARPRTLPLALACISMGAFLAADAGAFHPGIFALSILTTVCLQVLSNFANDYGDSKHGVDSNTRQGPSRAVQSGALSAAAMKKAIGLFVLLSLLSGLALLYVAFAGQWTTFLIMLGIGLAAIAAAIAYTATEKPYGYAGLGDLSVLLFFGLVAVLGSTFLYTGTLNTLHLLPALSCGLFATAVLNVNNIRDIESDREAGKKSIPVRLGRSRAVVYHWGLLLGGLAAAIAYSLLHPTGPWQWLFLAALPNLLRNGRAVSTHTDARALDPFLKQMALTTLLFVITFGVGLLVG